MKQFFDISSDPYFITVIKMYVIYKVCKLPFAMFFNRKKPTIEEKVVINTPNGYQCNRCSRGVNFDINQRVDSPWVAMAYASRKKCYISKLCGVCSAEYNMLEQGLFREGGLFPSCNAYSLFYNLFLLNYENNDISQALIFQDRREVAEINSLYTKLTPEEYPLINDSAIAEIKKDIFETYIKFFLYEDSQFKQKVPLTTKNQRNVNKHKKVVVPVLDNKPTLSCDRVQVLKSIKTGLELEKYILINKYNSELTEENLKIKINSTLFTYLYNLSTKITLSQLHTAVIMLPEWEGSIQDFERMVILL